MEKVLMMLEHCGVVVRQRGEVAANQPVGHGARRWRFEEPPVYGGAATAESSFGSLAMLQPIGR